LPITITIVIGVLKRAAAPPRPAPYCLFTSAKPQPPPGRRVLGPRRLGFARGDQAALLPLLERPSGQNSDRHN
jgi:hypothetical protein